MTTRNHDAAPKGPKPTAQELLAKYRPLVLKMAGWFQRKLPRNILREDVIAAGMGGLWDAIRRHPDGPSESFEWYVRVRVRGAIIDELRLQDWLPRRARAIAEAANAPAAVVLRFDDISDQEQVRALIDPSSTEAEAAAREAEQDMKLAVMALPEREQYIIVEHYFRGVKFLDIGTALGISEPRISQIHSRSMKKLREMMKRKD